MEINIDAESYVPIIYTEYIHCRTRSIKLHANAYFEILYHDNECILIKYPFH